MGVISRSVSTNCRGVRATPISIGSIIRSEKRLSSGEGKTACPGEVIFDYTNHSGRISALEPLRGRSGWLTASVLTIEALDTPEDHILLAGIDDDGAALSYEMAMRLLTLSAHDRDPVETPTTVVQDLDARLGLDAGQIQRTVSERNARFFGAEADKLDGWADDLRSG